MFGCVGVGVAMLEVVVVAGELSVVLALLEVGVQLVGMALGDGDGTGSVGPKSQ